MSTTIVNILCVVIVLVASVAIAVLMHLWAEVHRRPNARALERPRLHITYTQRHYCRHHEQQPVDHG